MERGWDATGRLALYWKAVGGRDGLAEAAGLQKSTVSGYNSGRLQLGMRNAERIALALGVTVFDLGAPTREEVAERSAAELGRLTVAVERLERVTERLEQEPVGSFPEIAEAVRQIVELERPLSEEERYLIEEHAAELERSSQAALAVVESLRSRLRAETGT